MFPLVPGGKRPLVGKDQGGRGCHDATADADQVRWWWRRWPDANVGAAAGSAFVALDVDGEEGLASLAEIEDLNRWLPVGPASVTGSGGLHLFFQASGLVQNTVRRLGPGLDTRGAGGSLVLPPSIHRNGCPYMWLTGREPWSLPLPQIPRWLADLLIPPQRALEPERWRSGPSSERYVDRVLARALDAVAAAPEGARNQTLFKAAASLARFVASGAITAREVGPLLVDTAVGSGLPRYEAEMTAASGLRRALA